MDYTIHLFLNRKWIANVFKGKLRKVKDIINIICDSLLLLGMLLIIITGILISNILFTFDFYIEFGLIFDIHNIASYICLGIMGFHVIVHLQYIFLAVRNILKNFKSKNVVKTSLSFTSAAIIIALIYLQFNFKWASELTAVSAESITTESSIVVVAEPSKEVTVSEILDSSAETTSSEVIESSAEESLVSAEESSPIESEVSSVESQEEIISSSEPVEENQSSEESIESLPQDEEEVVSVSLEEFLSGLFCTACGKHCPLTNPRCQKGLSQLQTAKDEYYSQYGEY